MPKEKSQNVFKVGKNLVYNKCYFNDCSSHSLWTLF